MDTVNSNILLVRVASLEHMNYLAMRDDILESVQRGVLILGIDDTLEVLELPPLGGVVVGPTEAPPAPGLDLEGLGIAEVLEPPAEEDGPLPVEITVGRNREEKQAILTRMQSYRKMYGLGCWDRVAKNAGRNITPDLIRNMLLGRESPPIADWRRIDQAMQSLEYTSTNTK